MPGSPYNGWAQSCVLELCRHETRNIEFCFNADRATRHYVAWAIRGYQKGGSGNLEELAGTIAYEKRREVIRAAWGFDAGSKLGALKRLTSRILPGTAYDELTAVLRDPRRRQFLYRVPRINAMLLHTIAHGDQILLQTIGPQGLTRVGPEVARYVLTGIRRARPELAPSELLARLRRSDCGDIDSWIASMLSDAVLPKAPWPGTDDIRPVRTVVELKRLGSRLQNCIDNDCRLLEAIRGKRAYYHCRVGRSGLIACLARDEVIDSWRLEEVRGPRNKTVSKRHPVVEKFARAGFPWLDEALFLGSFL